MLDVWQWTPVRNWMNWIVVPSLKIWMHNSMVVLPVRIFYVPALEKIVRPLRRRANLLSILSTPIPFMMEIRTSRACICDFLNVQLFHRSLNFGSPGGIRTHTESGLSRFPLPVGIRGYN